MHQLKLLVKDSLRDSKLIILSDFSYYDSLIPIVNATLYIQLPGFDYAIQVPFTVGSTGAYNTISLGLSTDGLMHDLPDGLYTCTYSVSPNSQIYTAVYHFRTTNLQKCLYTYMAQLGGETLDEHFVDGLGDNMRTKQENICFKALMLLEGIKSNISEDIDVVNATKQYKEVENLLSYLK